MMVLDGLKSRTGIVRQPREEQEATARGTQEEAGAESRVQGHAVGVGTTQKTQHCLGCRETGGIP